MKKQRELVGKMGALRQLNRWVNNTDIGPKSTPDQLVGWLLMEQLHCYSYENIILDITSRRPMVTPAYFSQVPAIEGHKYRRTHGATRLAPFVAYPNSSLTITHACSRESL